MIDYQQLQQEESAHQAAVERACHGKTEEEIVAMVEAMGHQVYWSRFGGYKFGSPSDDDVSEGYTAEGLYSEATRHEDQPS